MDILFDKIPETAVNNELYGMKLLSEKAVRLWNRKRPSVVHI